MDEVVKPKMKKVRQIIMVALLAISAALYVAGVYVSTTTTALDATMAMSAWLIAGSVLCAIAAAPESVVPVLALFGIYAFGALGSILHGIKYVEPLKPYAGYTGYEVPFLAISVLAFGGFAAYAVLVKGCRDKSRREKHCPEKYASWIPPVIGAALLFALSILAMGDWVAYQSDPGRALVALNLADYMGSHLAFEVMAALAACFTIFWVQSRKLWCKACIEAAGSAPAEAKVEGKREKQGKALFAVLASFSVFGKKKRAAGEPPKETPQEPPRRKGLAFSFAGKKEKIVVVGTEPMKDGVPETAAEAQAPHEKPKEKKPLFAMPSFVFGKKKRKEGAAEQPATAEKAPAAAMCEPAKEPENGQPPGPVCLSCGKEIYTIAYRCPRCSHYQEFGVCTSCKQEFTVGGEQLPAEVKCEKCGDVYHIEVWKGLRPAGPACSKCGGELYFTEHPCPECGRPQEFRICTKCGIEYSSDGHPLPAEARCAACGKEYGIEIWKGLKQKPEYCPICGAEANYVTIACPECGAEAQSRVCRNCGDLVTKCVECGAPNLLKDRICRGCGKSFGAPAAVCQKCGVMIGNPTDYVKQ